MATRIVHVDESSLHQEIDLHDRGGFAAGTDNGVYLIFWQGDIPVGHAWLPAQPAVLSARQLTRLYHGEFNHQSVVTDVDGPWPEMNLYERRQAEVMAWEHGEESPSGADAESAAEKESVAVIVCTVGRVFDLQNCLTSLAAANPAPDEIIVVDNSDVSTAVADICAHFELVKLVREPTRGLSVARNKGIAASRASILAFTDDDATVPANWIGRILNVFQHTESDVVTGSVLPVELETRAQDTFQFVYRIFDKGFEPKTYTKEFLDSELPNAAPVWNIGAGVNMAVRRSVFDLVGNFDELLGAGRAGVGEDSELWYRCLENNLTCHYSPGIHMFHSHRSTMSGLRRQIYLYWRGHLVTLLRQFDNTGRAEQRHRARRGFPRFTLGCLLRATRTRQYRVAWLRFTEVRGLLAGWHYYYRNRNTPQPLPGRNSQ